MAGDPTEEFPDDVDEDELEVDEDLDEDELDLDDDLEDEVIDDAFEADVDAVDDDDESPATKADSDDDEEDDEDDEDDEEEHDEALEELEAAELEIEDDPETLLVDEAAEIREMRREELGISAYNREQSSDEFVCTECFLVKNVSQLANKTKRICRDCI